jgi:hypothetical protein
VRHGLGWRAARGTREGEGNDRENERSAVSVHHHLAGSGIDSSMSMIGMSSLTG